MSEWVIRATVINKKKWIKNTHVLFVLNLKKNIYHELYVKDALTWKEKCVNVF